MTTLTIHILGYPNYRTPRCAGAAAGINSHTTAGEPPTVLSQCPLPSAEHIFETIRWLSPPSHYDIFGNARVCYAQMERAIEENHATNVATVGTEQATTLDQTIDQTSSKSGQR